MKSAYSGSKGSKGLNPWNPWNPWDLVTAPACRHSIEAHVLRSLRTEHGIPIKEVRQAIQYAENKLGIERLLLSPELCSAAGQLFLDGYGKLISLQPSGQLALRQVFDAYLKRVRWDDARFPVRLHPFLSHDVPTGESPIAIDVSISFGRPVILSVGVSTAAVATRIDAWRCAFCHTLFRLRVRFMQRLRTRRLNSLAIPPIAVRHASRSQIGRRRC